MITVPMMDYQTHVAGAYDCYGTVQHDDATTNLQHPTLLAIKASLKAITLHDIATFLLLLIIPRILIYGYASSPAVFQR